MKTYVLHIPLPVHFIPHFFSANKISVAGLLLLISVQLSMLWPLTDEFFTGDGVFYLSRLVEDRQDLSTLFLYLDDRDNYRPLTYIVASLIHRVAGVDPFLYHVVMILLHLLMTVLVFWASRLLLRSEIGALAAAGFFGLHGVAADVSFGITFLSDALYGIFVIFALIAFILFVNQKGRWWYLASLGSFLLSLLSKEPAVMFPLILLLLVVCVPLTSKKLGTAKLSVRSAVRTLLPFCVVGALYLGWYGLLTGGRYIPNDPSHPYHAAFTFDDLARKRHYLKWGFNIRDDFGTIRQHQALAHTVEKFLPKALAARILNRSEFFILLIGPLLLILLLVLGDNSLARKLAVRATLIPLMVASAIMLLAYALFSGVRRDKTSWFALGMFLTMLLPVLILPASKTMLHNLYVPVIGLGLILGLFVREFANRASRCARLLAIAIPIVLIGGGVRAIALNLKEGWPVTSSSITRTYLEDVQRAFPKLSSGAVLYFEKTGDISWPWYTDVGNLFRVYYGVPSLITLFGDYGQDLPEIPEGERMLVHFREVQGHLFVVNKKTVKSAYCRVELLDPRHGRYRIDGRMITDQSNYYARGDELTIRLKLTKPRYLVILPRDFRPTFFSVSGQLFEEIDGRTGLRIELQNQTGAELVLRGRNYR